MDKAQEARTPMPSLFYIRIPLVVDVSSADCERKVGSRHFSQYPDRFMQNASMDYRNNWTDGYII